MPAADKASFPTGAAGTRHGQGRWEDGPQPEAAFVGSPTELKPRERRGPPRTGTARAGPGRAGKGRELGREGPGCVCARWETGNSGASVRENSSGVSAEREERYMPSWAGCGRPGFGAAEQPRCHERRHRGRTGFSSGRFSEGCRKCRSEWGAGVSSPLSATVPGCRAELGAGCWDKPGPSLPSARPELLQPGPQPCSCLFPRAIQMWSSPGFTDPSPNPAFFPWPSKYRHLQGFTESQNAEVGRGLRDHSPAMGRESFH